MEVKAYLEITLQIAPADRPAAAKVYHDYRQPFFDTIPGAASKALLVRDEDVQVLQGFDSIEHAKAYLSTEMFLRDVYEFLRPMCKAEPEVRIYAVAG